MQIGILVGQTFAFDFGPDHESVHGASHALLTGLLFIGRVDLVSAGDALQNTRHCSKKLEAKKEFGNISFLTLPYIQEHCAFRDCRITTKDTSFYRRVVIHSNGLKEK